jgi:hypothetical protein
MRDLSNAWRSVRRAPPFTASVVLFIGLCIGMVTATYAAVIDNMRAVFGRSYAAEPDVLVEQLKADEAIAEADTLLLTVPNTLGVEYNAHVIESILTHVAPALGCR